MCLEVEEGDIGGIPCSISVSDLGQVYTVMITIEGDILMDRQVILDEQAGGPKLSRLFDVLAPSMESLLTGRDEGFPTQIHDVGMLPCSIFESDCPIQKDACLLELACLQMTALVTLELMSRDGLPRCSVELGEGYRQEEANGSCMRNRSLDQTGFRGVGDVGLGNRSEWFRLGPKGKVRKEKVKANFVVDASNQGGLQARFQFRV